MVCHARLTCNNDPVADFAASGNTALRNQHAGFSDFAVVTDHYEVIDFCLSSDFGIFDCSSVNAGVSADFDIIADYYAADRRDFVNFLINILVNNLTFFTRLFNNIGIFCYKAESVSAYAYVVLEDYAVSDV